MVKDQLSPLLYTKMQITALTFLRVLIGWHFLYEGLVKLYSPGGWTSEFFLLNSVGPFSSVLKSMAANHSVLHWVDQANMWGLILIGLCLFLGVFAKPAKILGILLLFLYYISYPPFAHYSVSIPVEGSYWIVNKNLIELAALVVLFFFPSSHITGLDRYLDSLKTMKPAFDEK
jgi:thiosulfate dehydrogenase [quinone] large subunit